MHLSILEFSNVADLAFCQRAKATTLAEMELTIIDVPLMIDMDPRAMKLVHMELAGVLFIFISCALHYQLPITLFLIFIENPLKVICPVNWFYAPVALFLVVQKRPLVAKKLIEKKWPVFGFGPIF